jgi:hypothetical protein
MVGNSRNNNEKKKRGAHVVGVAGVTILISYFILLILPPAGVGNTKLVDFII